MATAAVTYQHILTIDCRCLDLLVMFARELLFGGDFTGSVAVSYLYTTSEEYCATTACFYGFTIINSGVRWNMLRFNGDKFFAGHVAYLFKEMCLSKFLHNK